MKNHGVFDVASIASTAKSRIKQITVIQNRSIFEDWHDTRHFPNVEVVNLSRLPRTGVTENVFGKNVWIDLSDLLINDIDCLISVPVLKTHAMTHGSFSIKNLWVCYPDPMRLLYHKNLDCKLTLIIKLTKNKIQIVNGFWALDGHVPMKGMPVTTNKILISNDLVAVDSSSAYLMNLDINKIGHLIISEQYGLGVSDINKIQFNRDMCNSFKVSAIITSHSFYLLCGKYNASCKTKNMWAKHINSISILSEGLPIVISLVFPS